MTERIYEVKSKGGASRLVRASSRAQALGHVARLEYSVSAANSLTVAALLTSGTALEVAGQEAPADDE